MLLDDACVARRVGGGGRARLQRDQRRRAAHGVEEVGPAQRLGHGDGVDRLTLPVQRADRLVHVAVGRLVEVVGAEVDVDGGGDRVAAEEHGPEERLLGFEVVGRDAPRPRSLAATGIIDRLDHGRSL